MKKTKFLALVLALVLMFACAMPAHALTITVTNGTAAEYKAYRLFDLTTSLKPSDTHEDGAHTAECYNYAYTVNSKYAAALRSIDTVADDITDTALIDQVRDLDAAGIRAFADAAYRAITAAGLEADITSSSNILTADAQGYYMIVESKAGADPDSYSLVMLDTAGAEDIRVQSKEGVPTLTKKIIVGDERVDVIKRVDAIVAARGETVTFELTGTLPENFADYSSYQYTFHDTMAPGLTLDETSVEVYAGATKLDVTAYTLSTGTMDGHTMDLVINDLRTVPGLTKDNNIRVIYSATMNENAVSGLTGNSNVAFVEFTNNPYDGGTSKTATDTVKVFQFTVVINKVDKDGGELTGAEFKLYKKNGDERTEVTTLTTNDAKTTFTFAGLGEGAYELEETKVPAGYNKADNVLFKIKADVDTENDDPQLKGLQILQDGNVVSEGDNAKFTISADRGTATGEVVNTTGLQLPHTGELGRAILLYGGIGAIVLAGVAVILASRKKKAVK